MVLSRIEEKTLQRVAQNSGGAYVRSVAGSADMSALYQDEILGKLKRAEQLSRREKVWLERFQWPLGLGRFLALLAFAVRGRAVSSVLLVGLLMSSPVAMADGDSVARWPSKRNRTTSRSRAPRRSPVQAGRYNEADRVPGTSPIATDPGARLRAQRGLSAAAGRLTHASRAGSKARPRPRGRWKNAAAGGEIQKHGEEPLPGWRR